jgi:hypothetical protein
MQRKQETQASHARAAKPALAVKARGRRIVRTIAQGTLLAAGLAATHIGVAEIDERCPLFNPTLLDRLQAPITRYHE